jgi:hypothetical protein
LCIFFRITSSIPSMGLLLRTDIELKIHILTFSLVLEDCLSSHDMYSWSNINFSSIRHQVPFFRWIHWFKEGLLITLHLDWGQCNLDNLNRLG